MIGMPSSGKTTYLASLCRLLIHGGQETEWKLDIKDVPEGFERVRKMIKNLNSYQIVERTQGSDFYNIELNLYNQDQKCVRFVVPDSSGEIFRDLVYDRRMPLNIINQIIKSDMLLFFINVKTMIPEKRIKLNEKSAIKKVNEKQGFLDTKCGEMEEKEQQKFNNQSALVELLHSITYLVPHSLKIRFVISAWDLVEKEFEKDKVTPEEYIKSELPLLNQYLMYNSKTIVYDIWGVSAQGGDFDDEEDLLRLQSDKGEDYICVVNSEANKSKDLTKLL